MRIRDGTATVTSTTFTSNTANYGGAMSIYGGSTDVTLRQCSFTSNTASSRGHSIYTQSSPTIAVINTYIPVTTNNIYVNIYDVYTPTWKTCSSNVCTDAPFTGTCSAVNSGNTKLGVKCSCTTAVRLPRCAKEIGRLTTEHLRRRATVASVPACTIHLLETTIRRFSTIYRQTRPNVFRLFGM